MTLTRKEKAMLKKFFDASDDGVFCYTCFLCDSHSDSAIIGSLCRKGVLRHNGLGEKDAGVELVDSQTVVYA